MAFTSTRQFKTPSTKRPPKQRKKQAGNQPPAFNLTAQQAPAQQAPAHRSAAPFQMQSKIPAESGKDPQKSPAPAQQPKTQTEGTVPKTFADKVNYEKIAKMVHKGMKGAGTREEKVYVYLQQLKQDPEAITRLKAKYLEMYGESLDDALKDDFSKGELEFTQQLLNQGEEGVDQEIKGFPSAGEEWHEAVDRLRDAVEGKGTKEEAIFAVLLPFQRNPVILDLVKGLYQEKYGENLRSRLKKEMSGSEQKYALYLLGEQKMLKNDGDAEAQTQEVLKYIQTEAQQRAKSPMSIDPASKFYTSVKDRYLQDYLKDPSKENGQAAVEKFGKQMKGRINPENDREVQIQNDEGKWRPVENRWEMGAVGTWNSQEVPEIPGNLKDLPLFNNIKDLPRDVGAATDVMRAENHAQLPYLDVPHLLGKANAGTGNLMVDVVGGGKNISQLMHWATGIKYAGLNPKAMQELFLLYEMWHLEGFEVFGEDALNDMIGEEQGRIMGAELLKGKEGAIQSEADLLPFLNRSFQESRAWVGALLRLKRGDLDDWITSKQQQAATFHWDKNDQHHIWPSLTPYQMLADGMPLDDVKKSSMVESQIGIYQLLYEADNWEANNGAIELSTMEKALMQGKLDDLLKVIALKSNGKSIGGIDAAKAFVGMKSLDKLK